MNSDRDILLISIFTLLTVFTWVFFELAKTVKTTTVTQTIQEIIIPLDPQIDSETLSNIRNRQIF